MQHAVPPSARAAVLTMASRHESTKRQRPPPTEGHLASISAGAVAEAAAATRSAEENEAIANARVARKALHRQRGAGKIDKRDVNCHRYTAWGALTRTRALALTRSSAACTTPPASP